MKEIGCQIRLRRVRMTSDAWLSPLRKRSHSSTLNSRYSIDSVICLKTWTMKRTSPGKSPARIRWPRGGKASLVGSLVARPSRELITKLAARKARANPYQCQKNHGNHSTSTRQTTAGFATYQYTSCTNQVLNRRT